MPLSGIMWSGSLGGVRGVGVGDGVGVGTGRLGAIVDDGEVEPERHARMMTEQVNKNNSASTRSATRQGGGPGEAVCLVGAVHRGRDVAEDGSRSSVQYSRSRRRHAVSRHENVIARHHADRHEGCVEGRRGRV